MQKNADQKKRYQKEITKEIRRDAYFLLFSDLRFSALICG